MINEFSRKITKNGKLTLGYLLIAELIVLFSYQDIFLGFFQQDEWLSSAYNLSLQNKTGLELLAQFFSPNIGHYQPLNNIVLFTLVYFFSTNYLAFAVVSLSLHLVNVLLVFILAKEIFKNNKLSTLTTLFFGISASNYQATSWVMADVGIHFSTIFATASIIFLLKFLKYSKKKYSIICLSLLLISLLFKESVVGLFLFLPFIYYLLNDEKRLPKINLNLRKFFHKKNNFSILILGLAVVYVLIRAVFIFIPSSYSNDTLATQSQSIKHLTYNLVTLPIKGITQSVIPHIVLVNTARTVASFLPISVTGQPNTTQFDIFVEKRMLEVVNLLLFLLLLALFWLILRRGTKLEIKAAIFGGSLIILNSFIFAFTPERLGIVSLIDSRNLYLLSIGSAIFLVCGLNFLGNLLSKNFSLKNKFLTFFLILPILVINYFTLSNQLESLSKEGAIRKSILTQIESDYPNLPEKIIFFTQSNQSYYGLPLEEKILPFQSGFGQTLLVWYYLKEKFPLEFYQKKFLWNITDQGYKEIDGRGFGYFRDFNALIKTVKQNNLSAESVIAYSWSGNTEGLTKISDKLRKDINIQLR